MIIAIPRVAGWLAHWKESLESKDSKIWRPRQVYVGPSVRSYIPLELREERGDDITKVEVDILQQNLIFFIINFN